MRVANWETGSAMPSLLSKRKRYSLTAAKRNCSAIAVSSFGAPGGRAPTSRAELDGEILEARRRDVDRRLGSGLADAPPVLVRPRDVRPAPPPPCRRHKAGGLPRRP